MWVKQDFETLLQGECFETCLDEETVYNQLGKSESAIWSLLLASGYLRVEYSKFAERTGRMKYGLMLTNKETKLMFENMVAGWFASEEGSYNVF